MFTDAQADDLYELITERTGRSTIYTANRAPADWYPLFPNPVVAESFLDRLVNNSHVLLMDGPSYRPRKRPTRVSPDTKEVKPDYPATTDPVGNCVTPALGNSMTFHRLVQGRPYSRFVRRRAQPRGGYGQRRRLSC